MEIPTGFIAVVLIALALALILMWAGKNLKDPAGKNAPPPNKGMLFFYLFGIVAFGYFLWTLDIKA